MRRPRFSCAVLACTVSLLTATACSDSADTGSDGEAAPSSTTTSSIEASSTPQPTSCGPPAYSFPSDLYPFEDRCIDLGHGDYHYFDESPTGTPNGTALMVHGNPTSSFLYRTVARQLLDRGVRVVAVDHYGFGESAKPPVEEFGYRPSDHSDVLTDFVDALNLENVTLLVQDWGGPIGLGMAVRRPDQIRNILVMNTWAWSVAATDSAGPYGALTQWSLLNQQIGNEFVANGLIVLGAAGGLAAPYPEPQATAVKNAYLGPFFDPETGLVRSPTVAVPTNTFARSILEDTAMFSTLGDLEPITSKPVFFYFGAQDGLFGALRPNPDGTCAIGSPTIRDDGTFCVDGDGALVYPYIDRFRSLWSPEFVIGVEVNPLGNHFVQDQAPDRVAEIVDELNRDVSPDR